MFPKELLTLLDGYRKAAPNNRGNFYEDSPEKKAEAEWYVKLGWSVLHDYVNDRYGWQDQRGYFNYSTRRISILRAYGNGTQPIEKYQEILCPEDSRINVKTENGEIIRSALMNISFSPPKIFPIFKSVVKAQLLETNYDTEVSGVDPTTNFERKAEVAYKKLQLMPFIKELKETLQAQGVPIPNEKEMFDSEEEIDVFEENGGFKLQFEIELKKALQKTLQKSKYDGIRDILYDDAIDLGLYITKTYIDDVDGVPKTRYVDPEYFIGSWDRHNDKRDMWLAAEVVPMTLSDLIHKTKLTEEQAFQVIEQYSQKLNQNVNVNSNISVKQQKYNTLNDRRVYVLDCNFISTDTKKHIKYKSKTFGNNVFKEVGYEYELKDKDKERGVELYEYKYEKEYGFKMIVGTNVVFDFGECDTVKNNENKSMAKLSYHVYDTGLPSLVDRCVEFIDDACLATFKFRDALAKMPPPPRLQIEASALDQINLGGLTLNAMQAKDVLSQTGYLYFKSLSDHLEPVNGNYNAPVTSMNIDVMQDFNIFQGAFGTAMNMIRQVTGINEVLDSTSPSPRMGYGVSKLAYDAAKNTIKPLIYGYELMFLSMLSSASSLWLKVAANGDTRGAFNSLGGKSLDIFRIASKVPERDIDISVKILPSDEEKQLLLQQIIGLRDIRTQSGQGGIRPDIYFMLYRIIKAGNLDLAQFKLSQAIEKQRQQDMQEAEAREEANTKRLIAAAQEANKKVDMEAQAKLQQLEMKYNLELRNKLVDKLLQSGISEQQALVEAEMKVAEAQGLSPMEAFIKIKPFLDSQREDAANAQAQQAEPQEELQGEMEEEMIDENMQLEQEM
jgi:hypothetical protein